MIIFKTDDRKKNSAQSNNTDRYINRMNFGDRLLFAYALASRSRSSKIYAIP